MTQKSRLVKATIAVFIFSGFMGLFFWGLNHDPRKLPSQLIQQPVPNFSVKELLNLEQVHTQEIFQGKISLLNVWASWCPACYDEHPYWMEYAKIDGLNIVGLNYKDKQHKALKFLNDLGNPYSSILFDQNGRLGIEFGVYGAPETFIIDPSGKVRYRHVGVVSREVFEQVFKPIIDKINKGF